MLICFCVHVCSDMAELVSKTANAVMDRIQEMQSEQQHHMIISRL